MTEPNERERDLTERNERLADVQREGSMLNIRPIVAEMVDAGSEIFAANARDMIRNGENRGSDLIVERGERLGAVVIAAQWWAAEWQANQQVHDALRRVRDWAMVNEIADVPLDWAGLGEILAPTAGPSPAVLPEKEQR